MKFIAKNIKVTAYLTGGVGLAFDTSYNAIDKLLELKNNEYEITIEPLNKKRTGAQNRYLWALISEISKAENGSEADTEKIYFELIKETGAKVEYILALPETETALRQVFRAVIKVDERIYNNKTMFMFKCFAGSSTFDTKQMNLLIDKTIERAYENGIDTEYWKNLLKGD